MRPPARANHPRAAGARVRGGRASARRRPGGRRLPDAIDAGPRARLHGPRAPRCRLRDHAVRAWAGAGRSRQLNAPPAAPLLALQQVVLAQWAPERSTAARADAAAQAGTDFDSRADASPVRGGASPRADAVVVDQAVRAARQLGADPAASFINATLRRFLRERDALDARARQQPEARWNLPAWWLERLRADHPDHWQTIVAAGNRQAPLILRVNRRRADVASLLGSLRAEGWPAEPIEGDAIRLPRSTDVSRLPGFAEGLISVQDYGAQLAARWLDAASGHRVLDACAAPGGKTAHLLEQVDCDLLALDVDETRLRRVDDNLRRLGLAEPAGARRVTLRAADAADPAAWWDGRPFDRILLDAPCSASGIVGRHPDIRWLRRRSDLATLCRVQVQMLGALWPLLGPGGKLLYATCSVFRQEGEGVVGTFLGAHPEAAVLPLGAIAAGSGRPDASTGSVGSQCRRGADAGRILLPGVPFLPAAEAEPVRDHDGFYYCLLQKPV
ncbi:MAG: 16S rRNA (cytosine(967)-C(5))-methyltransferase RsmB [Burkholderiaceae bacterium]